MKTVLTFLFLCLTCFAQELPVVVDKIIIRTPVYTATIDGDNKRTVSIIGELSPDEIVRPIPKQHNARKYWHSPELQPFLQTQEDLPHDYSHAWCILWVSNHPNWEYANNWMNVVPEWPKVNRVYVRIVEDYFADIVVKTGVPHRIEINFFYPEDVCTNIPEYRTMELSAPDGKLVDKYKIPNDPQISGNWRSYSVK